MMLTIPTTFNQVVQGNNFMEALAMPTKWADLGTFDCKIRGQMRSSDSPFSLQSRAL